MKRILKIVAIIAIAAVFIGTFVFLYHKSKKPAARQDKRSRRAVPAGS